MCPIEHKYTKEYYMLKEKGLLIKLSLRNTE